jgi:hypothetical protein
VTGDLPALPLVPSLRQLQILLERVLQPAVSTSIILLFRKRGIMPNFLKRLYSRMIYLFRPRPTARDVEQWFEEYDAREQAPGGGSHDLARPKSRDTSPCDCLVVSGGKVIKCMQNVPSYKCSGYADAHPADVVSPLPVGGCRNLPK